MTLEPQNLRILALGLLLYLITPFLPAQSLPSFNTVTLDPAFELDGAGSNVDSLAFWETPSPTNTLLFVTAKNNDLLEIYRHPFDDQELSPLEINDNINGVAVDQTTGTLYVSDRTVKVFSLPDLQMTDEFGDGIIGVGENNLDLFYHEDGRTIVYVSDDHNVHRFVADSWEYLGSFAPPVTSIETVLADDFYQLILVPEEQGAAGNAGVYAYHPDGTPYLKNGTNVFGNQGEFDSDEEGILLYTLPTDGAADSGEGFYVVADQRADQTDLEFFDRSSWVHLGTLRLTGVSNTDGITSTQRAMPGYPMGLLAVINDDTSTAVLGWDAVFDAIDPYRSWAARQGLDPGVNAGFLDDPDQDLRPNVWEFGTAGNPLSPMDNAQQRLRLEDIDGTEHFVYTLPVREDAVFQTNGTLTAEIDGLRYELAGSANPIDFTEPVVEVVPARDEGLPELDEGWNYRSFRLGAPAGIQPSGFIRLSIGRWTGEN